MDISLNNLQYLQTLPLKSLRALCVQYGISASGNKKLLVDRLQVFTQTLQITLPSNIQNIQNIQQNIQNIQNIPLEPNNILNVIPNPNEELDNNLEKVLEKALEKAYVLSLKTQQEEEIKRKNEIIQKNLKIQDEIIQQNLEYEESLRMDVIKRVTEKLMKGDYGKLEKKHIEIFLNSIKINFSANLGRDELLNLVPGKYIGPKFIDSALDQQLKSEITQEEEEEKISIDELRRARLKYYS